MEFSSVAFQWSKTGSLSRTDPQSLLDGVRRSCHPHWSSGPATVFVPQPRRVTAPVS